MPAEGAPRAMPSGDEQDSDGESQRLLDIAIATAERAVFEGQAERVTAPAVSGQVTILVGHMALLAELEPGNLLLRSGDEIVAAYRLGGGFLEVRDDEVIVLADSADEIDVDQIAPENAAWRRTQDLLRSLQRPAIAPQPPEDGRLVTPDA